jgi:hypothetical protein
MKYKIIYLFILAAIIACVMGFVLNKDVLLYFIWANTFLILAYLSLIIEKK